MSITEDKELDNLIEKVKLGDDDAFAFLLSKYTPMLNRVISGFSNAKISYGEAFSEASVALYRSAMSYDTENGSVTFGLYSKICVYRRLCDFYAKATKDDVLVDLDLENIVVNNNIENRLVGNERMSEYLKTAEKILSQYEYEVFLLYVDGCDTKTIADKLGKDVKSVENAKSRMFRTLREESKLFSDSY